MRPLPSWSLSEPFCSTSWSMAVYSSSSTHVLLLAVFKQWSLIPSFLAGLTHLYVTVGFNSPKQGSCLRSWSTGLWRLEVFVEVRLWRRYPLVEEIIYVDKFKSCTLWWHLSFRTLDVSFSCLCLSLVLSINSPNATSLHSRCIWEGVLEYNSQG